MHYKDRDISHLTIHNSAFITQLKLEADCLAVTVKLQETNIMSTGMFKSHRNVSENVI